MPPPQVFVCRHSVINSNRKGILSLSILWPLECREFAIEAHKTYFVVCDVKNNDKKIVQSLSSTWTKSQVERTTIENTSNAMNVGPTAAAFVVADVD